MKRPKKQMRMPATGPVDLVTRQRHRIMMWSRFPAILAAAGACYLVGGIWPAFVTMALWFFIWLIWVANVFR